MPKEYKILPALVAAEYQENLDIVEVYRQLKRDILELAGSHDPENKDELPVDILDYGLVIRPVSAYVLGQDKQVDYPTAPFEIHLFVGIENLHRTILGVSRAIAITLDGQSGPLHSNLYGYKEELVDLNRCKITVRLDDKRKLLINKNYHVESGVEFALGDYREQYSVVDHLQDTIHDRVKLLQELKEKIAPKAK